MSQQQPTEIQQQIEKLVSLKLQDNSSIQGVRPSSQEQKTSYHQLMQDYAQVRGRPLFYPYAGTGRGRGPYVELRDGSVKLDFINGIGVHVFGHSHPTVLRAAVEGSLADILMQGHLQMNQEYLDFSQVVLEMLREVA
jgi:4-aminobutyrate aminotransferase-like enzyme